MEEKIYTAAAISGSSDTLEEALAIASRGWRVFPLYTPDASGVCNCPSGIACSNPGKHPRTKKGLHDGTTDATAIRAWWARYPATNYGIVTGQRSGIVVIDIDNRHQGPEGLAGLEAEHGILATALSQQSGDGQHLFFQHPGMRIPNGTALASGVDVRGDGGYVVGPGSRHANGQLYHWSTSAGRMIPLAILPTAWVGLLSKDRALLPGPSAGSIIQGQRNDQLFRIARAMRGRGKPEWEIRSELNQANLSRCVPPLDETEVAAIAKSATRYDPDRGFDLATSRAYGSYRPNNRPPDAVGRLVRLSTIRPEKVDWLWREWLPAGKVTVLDGDPGLGKTTLLLDLASRLSIGAAMPFAGQATEPRDVIFITAEDGLADTVRPRLEAAGADLERIRSIPIESDWHPSIPDDIEVLREWIHQAEAGLLVIDPLFAHFADGLNANSDHDVRRAIAPLAALAEDTKAGVVLVRHLRKSGADNALYRGGGSIGIIAAARTGLLVAAHPDDADLRVLAVAKTNLSAKPASMAFRLDVDEARSVSRVIWEGPVDIRADDLVLAGREELKLSRVEEAKEFLEDLLAGGPRPAEVVNREAKNAGIAIRTLQRAKEALDIEAVKVGFAGGGSWHWILREQRSPGRTKERHIEDMATFGDLWQGLPEPRQD